jgi:predicted TIM-barrel fold metal-dependent hydrolase
MNLKHDVFDFHVHLYPDGLAEKAVSNLSGKFGNPPSFDGTAGAMTRLLARNRFGGALNLPVATKPDQVCSINAWAIAINTPPIASLGTIHPDQEDIPQTLRFLKQSGLRGIKLHPEYQLFTLDDPRMACVWEICRDEGLFVYLHAGGERVFTPPFHTSPTAIAHLLDRYPGLTLIAAHLGGFQMWDESERELIGRNLYLDLSHTLFWMPDAQVFRMIRNHGADKIVFGSDAPWQDPAKVLQAFLQLPLSENEQRAILWENAFKAARGPIPETVIKT